MDINPIIKYLNTLKRVGSINNSETGILSVYLFISYIIENEDEIMEDNQIVKELNDIMRCLRRRSCLMASVLDFECIVREVLEGLLQTAGGTIICTAGGVPIKLMS